MPDLQEVTRNYKKYREAPREIRDAQRYNVQVAIPGSKALPHRGTCADYTEDASGLTLLNCILDSSDYVMGTCMEQRWTHHDSYRFGGIGQSWHWSIRPIYDEERGTK